jgi:hypothetical protein
MKVKTVRAWVSDVLDKDAAAVGTHVAPYIRGRIMSASGPNRFRTPFRQSDSETNIDGACDGKCALSAGRNRQHNTRSSPRGNPTLPRLLQPVSVSRDTS